MNQELPQYSRLFRFIEYASLISFTLMWSVHFYGNLMAQDASLLMITLMLFLSWICADLVSGLVHWFADTWGTGQWPVLGPSLIRSFREHHVDDLAITRHDFVETNGASALVCLPILIALFFFQTDFYLMSFSLFFTFWILLTNQFHKWSHELNPPVLVLKLQRLGLILSRENHDRHHKDNHTENYFITNGFINYFIGRKCFDLFERLIQKSTGLVPREDDAHLLASFKAAKKLATPTIKPENTSQK